MAINLIQVEIKFVGYFQFTVLFQSGNLKDFCLVLFDNIFDVKLFYQEEQTVLLPTTSL